MGGLLDAGQLLEVIDEHEDEALINPQRRTGSISFDSKIIKKGGKKSGGSGGNSSGNN
jgi:hypothetical protein